MLLLTSFGCPWVKAKWILSVLFEVNLTQGRWSGWLISVCALVQVPPPSADVEKLGW
jgi:hypothetical protein